MGAEEIRGMKLSSNRMHEVKVGVDKLSANTNLLYIIGPGLLLIKQFITKSYLFRETLHKRVQ